MGTTLPLQRPGGFPGRNVLKRLALAAGLNRQRVTTMRIAFERNALALSGRRHARTGGRILCYHSFGQPECGINDVNPGRFARQIDQALDLGYRFVPAAEIARSGGGRRDLAVTFDDGFKSVLTEAFPILSERRIPWSLFVVPKWCDEATRDGTEQILNWRDVERLVAGGADLGSHSMTNPDFGPLDEAAAVIELEESRRLIEARLGFAPESFAIPFGQSRNWTDVSARAAAAAGYSRVYAQAEQTRPVDTIARTFVTQVDDTRIFRALLDGAFDAWEE